MDDAAAIAIQEFSDAWRAAFSRVLESLGAPAVCSWSAPLAEASVPAAPNKNAIATRFQVSKGLQGSAFWLCEQPVAVQFAQLLQSEALDPAAEFSELHRDAFAEFLRQVAGQAAAGWKAATSSEIDLTLAEPHELPSLQGTQTCTLEVTSDKFPSLAMQFFLDPPLFAALVALPSSEETAAIAGAPGDALESLSLGATPNLALLLDVELQATIRFGQRDMLLREVFALMPGAVVELNQFVNEPAELLVAGRLIARGEVVVVDGNFGLRVSEVAAAGQRAALLDL
ncbi:MAG TPA: FliM/FliN family flagellar motor switch protein [Candidatus Acidoferrum sp.]|nr:FliM/FliN family flagellar motor switch protein [Candidatus Acidoferrum sp.]